MVRRRRCDPAPDAETGGAQALQTRYDLYTRVTGAEKNVSFERENSLRDTNCKLK